MYRFKKGDRAIVTNTIRRHDNRSVASIGDAVDITDVYNGGGHQIVAISPVNGALPMVDIVCYENGPLALSI